MIKPLLNRLYRSEGYCVDSAECEGDQIIVTLRADLRYSPRCPRCEEVAAVNRTEENSARDLPLGPVRDVWVRYPAGSALANALQANRGDNAIWTPTQMLFLVTH